MSDAQRERLMDSFAADIEPVDEKIQKRHLAQLHKANPRWDRDLASRLGLAIESTVSEDLVALADDTVGQAEIVAELFE